MAEEAEPAINQPNPKEETPSAPPLIVLPTFTPHQKLVKLWYHKHFWARLFSSMNLFVWSRYSLMLPNTSGPIPRYFNWPPNCKIAWLTIIASFGTGAGNKLPDDILAHANLQYLQNNHHSTCPLTNEMQEGMHRHNVYTSHDVKS